MARVLITGGAGFIGQRTARALAERGDTVRIMDSLAPPVHPTREWPDGMTADYDCILGDVRSADDWRRAMNGIDAVVHLAAYQDYLPDFSTFLHANAAGTALLYEVIVASRFPVTRVVVASSQAVYGEGTYRCTEHGLQRPDARSGRQLAAGHWEIGCPVCSAPMMPVPTDESRPNPQNAYGISKLAQELCAVHLGRRYEIPTVALRFSITQGAGQSFHNAYSGICRIFSLCALAGLPFPIYEDGGQLRDYVYVGEVVKANLMALQDDRMRYRSFNVGGSAPLTVLEYARLVAKIAGVEAAFDRDGVYRVGDTRHVVSDSSSLKSLGWWQTTTVATMIAEYLDWVRSQPLPEHGSDRARERMRELGAIGVAA